jgi:hypothetical protein
MLALETRLETMAQQALELVKSMEAARMAAIGPFPVETQQKGRGLCRL